jgi:hypothetical protein
MPENEGTNPEEITQEEIVELGLESNLPVGEPAPEPEPEPTPEPVLESANESQIANPEDLEPYCLLTGLVENPALIVERDFTKIRQLYEDFELQSGKLVHIDFYLTLEAKTAKDPAGLAIRELQKFYYDATYTIERKERRIFWYNSDGSVLAEKQTESIYEGFDRKRDGDARRSAIVYDLKEKLERLFEAMGQAQAGIGLLSSLSDAIVAYQQGNTAVLVNAVNNLPAETGLDQIPALDGNGTLRQYIVRQLDTTQRILKSNLWID